jgi:hypothetical protein
MIAEAPLDGVSAIALVLIASFAVDRVVTGILFLLGFNKKWVQWCPDPKLVDDRAARTVAERRQKLAYFILAGFFGIIVLAGLGHVRILTAMGLRPGSAMETSSLASLASASPTPAAGSASPTPAPAATLGMSRALFSFLDILFTGLLLMGGADSISRVLKLPGVATTESPPSRPIEITGKLTLEDRGPGDRSK